MSTQQRTAAEAGVPAGQQAREPADFEPQPPGTATPDGRDLQDQAWSRVRFDIVLAPAGA